MTSVPDDTAQPGASGEGDDIAQWIARVTTGDPAAFDALVTAGEPVIPALVAALNHEVAVPVLTAVLAGLALADPIATLGPLAEEAAGSGAVAEAALAALAASGDPRALPILAASPRRFAATVALGDLGDARAIAILRARAAPWLGDDLRDPPALDLSVRAHRRDLQFLLTVASALAKLGDHSLTWLAVSLAGTTTGGDPAAEVRRAAARALCYVTGPGVATALHQLARDPDEAVAITALHAMLYLGRIDEVDGWIAALAAGGRVAATAQWCLEAFAGEHPMGAPGAPVSQRHAQIWWDCARDHYRPGVCYRLGEPAHPAQLVALLSQNPAHLRAELRIRTGIAIADELGGFPVSRSEHARIAAWSHAHAAQFQRGELHRWGRSVSPLAVD